MERPLTTAVQLRHYGHADLPDIRQTLLDVHADAYADRRHEEFVQRFPWFVDHWGGREGFACVVAYEDSEPIGFTYGAPGEPGREWWREYLDEEPADPSTFSVSELMLRPKWRKQGLGE
ncbi:GNAT family N-acetyltransferase, partial [Streptomyces sp. NPDC000987]|uniref:GNAT family N-acetyltransferase n=1 Tax=Streptomyces sp. NPDC000987 TaxID=3154374 RepID=UPI003325D926